MPLTQADGKQSATPSNNTLGTMVSVNRESWRTGFRRQLLIEVDRDIRKQQFFFVVSFRLAIVGRDVRSTATHTAGIFNIKID